MYQDLSSNTVRHILWHVQARHAIRDCHAVYQRDHHASPKNTYCPSEKIYATVYMCIWSIVFRQYIPL